MMVSTGKKRDELESLAIYMRNVVKWGNVYNTMLLTV
jgi:hypothetical protein